MQITTQDHRRYIGVAATICYLLLLAMALYFYKERIFFSDTGFYIFEMVRTGNFTIQHGRFVAYFTEIFPIGMRRLEMPLASIVMAHSISFVLLNIAGFVVLYKGFKQHYLALAFLFFNVLMARHTFYYCLSELVQGVTFFFFYIALLMQLHNRQKARWWQWLLAILSLVVAVFSHPMMLFYPVFILSYLVLKYRAKSKVFIIGGIVYALFQFLKMHFFKSPYDVGATQRFYDGLALLPHFYKTTAFKDLVEYFIKDYYLIAVLMIATLVYYLREKQWIMFAFILSYSIGFLIINIITEPNGTFQFYLEARYILFSLFVIFPLVYDVLGALHPKLWIALVTACLAISLLGIFNTHGKYSARVAMMNSLLQEMAAKGQEKIIVPQDALPAHLVMMTWPVAYECWGLSMISQGVSRGVIISENDQQFAQFPSSKKGFLSINGYMPYCEFPNKYFIFKDSANYYQNY